MNLTQSFSRHQSRGSVLAGAVLVVFMLLVVVMALHHHQAVARQAYMVNEADLRFREGAQFELQRQILGVSAPGGLVIGASVTNDTASNVTSVGNLVAQNIFDRTKGLPDLRALQYGPSHTYFSFHPDTSDASLKVFGKRFLTVVLSQVPGYAAFAPAGSVNITRVEGWANPTFDDTRKSLEAFSGVPALVAGLKDSKVVNMTYGEVYSINGTASVTSGQGAAFQQEQFPVRAYHEGLITQIQQARSELGLAAASGDKTLSLVSTSTGPEAIVNLFFGGGSGLENFLSLRNANHFWMPMIPGFSPSPPYLYEFYFSVPFPPDNADYANSGAEQISQDLDAMSKQLKDKEQEAKDAEDKLNQAQADYNANPNAATQQALADAQANYNQKKSEFETLKSQIQSKSDQLSNTVDQGRQSGMKGVPQTRSQDPSGNDGITGWNYSMAWNLLGQLVSMIATFDATKLSTAVSNEDVKLIHFGGKDRTYGFNLSDSSMLLDATVTVPRGRSLKLRSPGTITIRGDLWLQRGSTMVVECSRLVLEDPPGGDSSNFFSPCGRLFLEEGSSLICTGDIEIPGSSQWGSVVVGGVPGQIHPITTAIMGKSVTLTNGVFAGCAIDDLVEGLSGGNAALKSLNDNLLRPLLSTVGPNAAKALGPFWPRKPYFAKYATTFQVIIVPTIFGIPTVPVPTPIPLPRDNVLVPIARALAFVYSTTLNLSLGENLYTHSDWWIFGEGVVPMVPQLNPTAAVAAIANFPSAALNSLNPSQILTSFIDSAIKSLVEYVIAEVIHKIVEKVALQVIPYGGLVGMLGSMLPDIADNLTGREKSRDSAGDALIGSLSASAQSAASSTLNSLKSKFDMAVQDLFLREYNGVLVYADTLTVGGRQATGMFVTEGNLNMNAEQCVGTLLSRSGAINCRSLLYYPYFNRASLYIPKSTPSDWLGRAMEFQYDADFNSNRALDVGPPEIPQKVSAIGWSR